MRYVFPARLEKHGRTVVVTFRDLPEAITEGDGHEDAQRQAVDCLDVALLFRLKEGTSIPAASAVQPDEVLVAPTPTVAAKVAFVRAFKDSGLSRVALAQRMGVGETEIRRMLDPDHHTKLDRMDEGLRHLGRRLVIDDEAA